MLTNHITIPEVIWTVLCGIGLYFNASHFRQAVGDYVWVRHRRINSIREYAAITTMLMFGSWTLVQLAFVLLGGVAMLIPQQRVVGTGQLAFSVSFILVSAFLAIMSYILNARRKKLIEKIADLEDFSDK